MKTVIRLVIALSLALAACAGSANPALQRGQRGQGRQNRMAGMALQSALSALQEQSDPLQLVFRKDVQHDMQMDLGQRNKFDNLHDKQANELQQARLNNRRNPAAVNAVVASQKKETKAKVDELLTDKQKQRLNQIAMQLQGNAAIVLPAVQKQLNLTDEQKQRVNEIRAQREQQIAQLQAQVAQGSTVPQDVTVLLQQIQSDNNAAYGEVLTPEQQDQFKKLQGPAFKAAS